MLLLIPSFALAQRGHLVILSVASTGNGSLAPEIGGTADLYLEIGPGTGQVFIDSFPLTKLDTQSSTRFANRIACSYAGVDCSQYDFYYTIRADSTVIGGPSAGAAFAVLTAAMLLHEPVNESIAITGTINSGGIVGPVAGVKPKAEAAAARGLSEVLISAFSYPTELNESYVRAVNGTDATLNLSRLYVPLNLSTLSIPVRQVATLDEALSIFTGRARHEVNSSPTPDPEYVRIMRSVADGLCTRRSQLAERLNATNASERNVTAQVVAAEATGDWYSAASYCFGDLVRLRGEDFAPLSQQARRAQYTRLAADIASLQRSTERHPLATLADLETSVIVLERLREAGDALQEENVSNISAESLGFAYERYNSARSWLAFFGMRSPRITLDQQHLRAACAGKIVEADERIGYAALYLPDSYLADARKELGVASADQERERFTLCLFRAAKAQAQADLLAGTISVPKEKLDSLVQGKLAAAGSVIAGQERKGLFPLLGYSYYRYAQSLAAHDPYSALTFAEYSLELSDPGAFFPSPHPFRLDRRWLSLGLLFLSGCLLGLGLGLFFGYRFRSKGRVRRSRTRHK